MSARVANQLDGDAFVGIWRNRVINANTVAVLLRWKSFCEAPRPLLPLAYIVVLEQDEAQHIARDQWPNEPKVRMLQLPLDSSLEQQKAQIKAAIEDAQLEHHNMTKLKLMLRQLRRLASETGVHSVDDLVSACKGYDTEKEQLGKSAMRRRRPEIFRPPPKGPSFPSFCEQQLIDAGVDLIDHDALRVGSMPLRLAFLEASDNDAQPPPSDGPQRNARVIKLVQATSHKADELRRAEWTEPASAQEAFAILPLEPGKDNGYAAAVLDGLDQLNYARYLIDAQGAQTLPPEARLSDFRQLLVATQRLLASMPESRRRR